MHIFRFILLYLTCQSQEKHHENTSKLMDFQKHLHWYNRPSDVLIMEWKFQLYINYDQEISPQR